MNSPRALSTDNKRSLVHAGSSAVAGLVEIPEDRSLMQTIHCNFAWTVFLQQLFLQTTFPFCLLFLKNEKHRWAKHDFTCAGSNWFFSYTINIFWWAVVIIAVVAWPQLRDAGFQIEEISVALIFPLLRNVMQSAKYALLTKTEYKTFLNEENQVKALIWRTECQLISGWLLPNPATVITQLQIAAKLHDFDLRDAYLSINLNDRRFGCWRRLLSGHRIPENVIQSLPTLLDYLPDYFDDVGASGVSSASCKGNADDFIARARLSNSSSSSSTVAATTTTSTSTQAEDDIFKKESKPKVTRVGSIVDINQTTSSSNKKDNDNRNTSGTSGIAALYQADISSKLKSQTLTQPLLSSSGAALMPDNGTTTNNNTNTTDPLVNSNPQGIPHRGSAITIGTAFQTAVAVKAMKRRVSSRGASTRQLLTQPSMQTADSKLEESIEVVVAAGTGADGDSTMTTSTMTMTRRQTRSNTILKETIPEAAKGTNDDDTPQYQLVPVTHLLIPLVYEATIHPSSLFFIALFGALVGVFSVHLSYYVSSVIEKDMSDDPASVKIRYGPEGTPIAILMDGLCSFLILVSTWFFCWIMTVGAVNYIRQARVVKLAGYLARSHPDEDPNMPMLEFDLPQNVRAWSVFRTCLQHFGARYSQRIKLYTYFLFAGIVSLIFYFIIESASQTDEHSIHNSLSYVVVQGIVFVSTMLVIMTISGADSNDLSNSHHAYLAKHLLQVQHDISQSFALQTSDFSRLEQTREYLNQSADFLKQLDSAYDVKVMGARAETALAGTFLSLAGSTLIIIIGIFFN